MVSHSLYTEYLIYDGACHLKKYATNSKRACITHTANRIASLNIVVDRFHFSGHVDQWCKQNCDPDKFDGLKKVSCLFQSAIANCHFFKIG